MPPKRKVSEPEIKSTEMQVAGARARKQFVPFGSSSTGNEPDSATTTPKKAHKKSASFSMAPLSPDKAASLVDDIDAEVEAPKSSDSNLDLHARLKVLEDKFQAMEQKQAEPEQPKAKKSKLAAAPTGGEESASDAAQVQPKRRQKKVLTAAVQLSKVLISQFKEISFPLPSTLNQTKTEASAPENVSAAGPSELVLPTVELDDTLQLGASNQMQVAAAETAAKPAQPAPPKIFDFDAFSTAPSSLTYAQVAAKGAAPALQLGDHDHAAASAAGFTTAPADRDSEPSMQMLPKELEPAADASHQTVIAFLESSTFPAAVEKDQDRVDRFKDDHGSGQADDKMGAGMEEKLNVHFADEESKAAHAKNTSEHSNSSDAGTHEREEDLEIGGDSASASFNSKKLTLDLDFMAE